MSFPRYEKYKPSGVEWLGDVPEHWSVSPFKWQIERNDGGVWGDDPDGLDDTIVLRSTEQTVDGRWQLDDPAPRKLTASDVSGSLLAEGDLLLTKSSGSSLHIGKTTLVTPEIAAMRCCYSNFMQRIRTRSSFSPKLAWHVLNNDLARRQFDLLSNSTTGLANLNGTMIGQIIIPIAPLAEQTQIAAFLDRETAKIDELVAEQRRLMELLKEKRQAVISHAVTQGLNPKAPMKPSGIEWLGDVPEHWKVGPVKYVAKIGNGSTPSREVPEYWGESGFPWLNSSVVNSAIVTEAEGYVTERALRECHLPVIVPPAVLVGITGQGRTRGMASMLGIEATINQHVAYVKPIAPDFDVNFLLRIFEMAYLKLRHDSEEAGATKGAITCGQIGNLKIPIPPLTEQQVIVAHLDRELAKFDTLTAEAQRAIDLLQERRTALISAAVTGQIDVRAGGQCV